MATEFETLEPIFRRIAEKQKYKFESSANSIKLEQRDVWQDRYLTLSFNNTGNLDNIDLSTADNFPG